MKYFYCNYECAFKEFGVDTYLGDVYSTEVYDHTNVPRNTPVTFLTPIFQSNEAPRNTLVFKDSDEVLPGLYANDNLPSYVGPRFSMSRAFDKTLSRDTLYLLKDIHGYPYLVGEVKGYYSGVFESLYGFCCDSLQRVFGFARSAEELKPEDYPILKPFLGAITKGAQGPYPMMDLFAEYFTNHPRLFASLDLPFHFLVCLFNPTQSAVDPTKIALFQSSEEIEAGERKYRMKPGKAFKKMFPQATDKDVEDFVDLFRHRFPVTGLIFKQGEDRQDFRHAYSHDIYRTENVRTTQMRKSLACSCMRYSHWKVHPAEAYASGDFAMFWSETEDGLIASRSVAHIPSKTWGPVYGTTEFSVDYLEDRMKALGFKSGKGFEHAWHGAKMLALPAGGDSYYFPYVDFGYGPGDEIHSDGFLHLSDCDDRPTEGTTFLGGNGYWCGCCGERFHEDDVMFSDYGDPYCEDCFHQEFFICDYNGQVYRIEDQVEVHSRYCTEYVAEENLDTVGAVWLEARCEWWKDTYCVYLEYLDESAHMDDVVVSDLSGEYCYPEDLEQGLKDGESIQALESEFEDEGFTYDTARHLWVIAEEEKEAA